MTGIRFLAACWVLAFHTMPRDGLPLPLLRLVEAGFLGVSLFFVLSGFILAHVYQAAATAPRFAVAAFLRARFARVYPAYLAGLLLAIPLFVHDLGRAAAPRGATLAGVCTTTVAMLQAWVPGWGCWWNCPGWSLSVEAFLYLAFPLIAPWLLRQGDRMVGVVALIATVALATFGLAIDGETPALVRGLAHAANALHLTSWTPVTRLPEFVLGLCAARLMRDADGRPRLGAAWSLMAGLLLVVVAVGTAGWPGGMARTAAIALPSALLISALADPARSNWLGSATLVRLGNASYALYLIHTTVFAYFLAAANRTLGVAWAHTWMAFLLYLVLVVGLSLVLHDRLEVPARRVLRGRSGTAAAAPTW